MAATTTTTHCSKWSICRLLIGTSYVGLLQVPTSSDFHHFGAECFELHTCAIILRQAFYIHSNKTNVSLTSSVILEHWSFRLGNEPKRRFKILVKIMTQLRFCTSCFYFPPKMRLLSTSFFPLICSDRCSVSSQKVSKVFGWCLLLTTAQIKTDAIADRTPVTKKTWLPTAVLLSANLSSVSAWLFCSSIWNYFMNLEEKKFSLGKCRHC